MSQVATGKTSDSMPPLQPGDRLKRAEFERRFNGMPECKNAIVVDRSAIQRWIAEQSTTQVPLLLIVSTLPVKRIHALTLSETGCLRR